LNVERRIGEKSAGKKFKDCVAWSLEKMVKTPTN
jgi:hypothetical protein